MGFPVLVGGEKIPGGTDILDPFVGLVVDFGYSLLKGYFRIHECGCR